MLTIDQMCLWFETQTHSDVNPSVSSVSVVYKQRWGAVLKIPHKTSLLLVFAPRLNQCTVDHGGLDKIPAV